MPLGSIYLDYFLAPHKLQDVISDLQELLPQCATDCLTLALKTVSTCSPDNATCICTDPNVAIGMHTCASGTCTIKQALTALNLTATMCQRPVRDMTRLPVAIASVSDGVAALAAVLRTANTLLEGHFGWDDACALVAGICSIPMNVLILRMASAGLGGDTWTLPFRKLEWWCQIMCWPTTALAKLAFLLMYLRIFPQEKLRTYVYTTIAVTAVYWLFFEFAIILYCRPIKLVWEGWDGEHEGKYWNINHLILAASGCTIALDLAIILLPVQQLLQLSMSWKRKLEILTIFLVGVFTLIVSCIRVYMILNYAESLNPTWDNRAADDWSLMEANSSVLCVCIPAIRRLIAHRIPAFKENAHVRDTDDSPTHENILQPRLSETQHSADDDDDELIANGHTRAVPTGNVQDRRSLTVEYPWGRKLSETRRPSKDTSASKDELPQASYERTAETEHIKFQQGPNRE